MSVRARYARRSKAKTLSAKTDHLGMISSGLAGFCQKVEKNDIFHGKNRTGKNRFWPAKIGFCRNILLLHYYNKILQYCIHFLN